jgi:phosphoenolpyruvate carboxykinase (GTP)
VSTPIGRIPHLLYLNVRGLELPHDDLEALFAVDDASWLAEADLTESFFDEFGERVPAVLREQLDALRRRLRADEDLRLQEAAI